MVVCVRAHLQSRCVHCVRSVVPYRIPHNDHFAVWPAIPTVHQVPPVPNIVLAVELAPLAPHTTAQSRHTHRQNLSTTPTLSPIEHGRARRLTQLRQHIEQQNTEHTHHTPHNTSTLRTYSLTLLHTFRRRSCVGRGRVCVVVVTDWVAQPTSVRHTQAVSRTWH